jgi:hypothetical protein
MRIFSALLHNIYATTAVEFRTPDSLGIAVNKLAVATKEDGLGIVFSDNVVGKVTAELTKLRRNNPWLQNSFAPIFTGRFERRDDMTVLTGGFRLQRFTQGFMTLVLVFIALWITGVITLPWFAEELSTASWLERLLISTPFIGAGLLFVLAIGLFVKAGKYFSRKDSRLISEHIEKALRLAAE